jgi:sialate O-acetylesterase
MKYICLLAGLMACFSLQATVQPHSLFSSHAVFQQGIPVPVWGTAGSGELVIVEFNGQLKQTTAENSKWMVRLDPMGAGGPYDLSISGAGNRVVTSDIYVGEVWICSGQSNMERQLGPRAGQPLITNWEAERDAADYPLIREYYVPISIADHPREERGSRWVVCSPATVSDFSAVGYFFARDLYKNLKTPVGIIFTAAGGTRAEFWTSRAGLESHPEFKTLVENYDQSLRNYSIQLAEYKREKSSETAPANPAESGHVSGHYNAMIAPLLPYAIKGVIWYQGESDNDKAEQYKTMFPLMIKDWRDGWGQGDFPFLFVQIAPYVHMSPEIREAQLLSLKSTRNTAMVVTTDCGDPYDIHPPHKQPVGYRLSLAARALAYGEEPEYSGPLFEFMEINGPEAIVYFSHARKGLVSSGGALSGFSLAGADGVYYPANATIVKNSVVVTSPQVRNPVSLHYGWENIPDVNLFNAEGLPASPFRASKMN